MIIKGDLSDIEIKVTEKPKRSVVVIFKGDITQADLDRVKNIVDGIYQFDPGFVIRGYKQGVE